MSKKPDLFNSSAIPDHERPLGRLLSDAKGEPFAPLRSLEEARADPDGHVILQGDDGGQVYIVAPASFVQCSASSLYRLLRDIDEIEWPGNPADMGKVFFERLRAGMTVAGGMGGGQVNVQPWIHERLEAHGLRPAILAVLRGEREAIRWRAV